MKEGRGYEGVNLSDPEGKWVYYSPMSWHPDSTRAMWNESTRRAQGNVKSRLRRCRLLDVQPSVPVPAVRTPDREEIPYALPVESAGKQQMPQLPLDSGEISGQYVHARGDGDSQRHQRNRRA